MNEHKEDNYASARLSSSGQFTETVPHVEARIVGMTCLDNQTVRLTVMADDSERRYWLTVVNPPSPPIIMRGCIGEIMDIHESFVSIGGKRWAERLDTGKLRLVTP